MVPSAVKQAAHNVHHYPRLTAWILFWCLWILAVMLEGALR